MQETHICPISLECGLAVPRRSIDVTALEHNKAAAAIPNAMMEPADAHRLAGSAASPHSGALSRPYSTTGPKRPMTAGPTPAEFLTSDGRLNVSSMMDYSCHVQNATHLPRIGSIRFKAASRGSVSDPQQQSIGRPAGQSSNGTVMSGVSSAASLQGKADNTSAASDAASNVPDALSQLTKEQQQLAAACQSKDLKVLQQVLAGPVAISAALDNNGNTALHLLLLPTPPSMAAMARSASLQHLHSNESCTPVCTTRSSSGSFGWLTSCFNGSKRGHVGRSSLSSASLSLHPSVRGRTIATAANAAMVSALLSANADTNVRNHDGLTPIMLAVQQLVSMLESSSGGGRVAATLKVLDVLCKHPMADLNMRDLIGRTALTLLMMPTASLCGCTSDHSASVAAISREGTCGVSPVTSGSAAAVSMSATAAATHLRAVQLLIHCGADINAADHHGMTVLMHAAAQPAVTKELLQLLLESGANPMLFDNKRRSALTHALVAQQLKLQPALRPGYDKWHQSIAYRQTAAGVVSCSSRGMKQMGPTSASSFAGMPAGAEHGDSDAAVAPGGNCSTPASLDDETGGHLTSSNSSSGSHEVCMKPHYHKYVSPFPLPSHGSVIRALCSYGSLDLYPSSINTRFPAIDGYSQLHIAMRRGDSRAQELLLAGGADVNALDTWGNSPLMYWPAAPTSPPELVETLVAALLRHGADPNLPNNDGWTPLDLACDLDKFGTVHVQPKCVPVHALLVGYGANNSDAFMQQHRHQPTMMCLRTDSANSVLRVSRSCDSLRVVVPSVADTADLMHSTLVPEERQRQEVV